MSKSWKTLLGAVAVMAGGWAQGGGRAAGHQADAAVRRQDRAGQGVHDRHGGRGHQDQDSRAGLRDPASAGAGAVRHRHEPGHGRRQLRQLLGSGAVRSVQLHSGARRGGGPPAQSCRLRRQRREVRGLLALPPGPRRQHQDVPQGASRGAEGGTAGRLVAGEIPARRLRHERLRHHARFRLHPGGRRFRPLRRRQHRPARHQGPYTKVTSPCRSS